MGWPLPPRCDGLAANNDGDDQLIVGEKNEAPSRCNEQTLRVLGGAFLDAWSQVAKSLVAGEIAVR
jgi:hypothetical protein